MSDSCNNDRVNPLSSSICCQENILSKCLLSRRFTDVVWEHQSDCDIYVKGDIHVTDLSSKCKFSFLDNMLIKFCGWRWHDKKDFCSKRVPLHRNWWIVKRFDTDDKQHPPPTLALTFSVWIIFVYIATDNTVAHKQDYYGLLFIPKLFT